MKKLEKTLINICNNKRKELQKLIDEITRLDFEYILKQSGDGEEQRVQYDISEAWEEYIFILNGVLYRWDNCIQLLKNIIEDINKIVNPLQDGVIISGNQNCDKLSYEFENLIVSFPRLNEEPTITSISRTLSKSNKKLLENNCLKKNDKKGLYWQLNLIRNRFAHSTPGYYSTDTEYAQRYLAISSKILPISIKNNEIILNTTLINLTKNEYIQSVIQDVIIYKKYGEEESKKNIMDLLFSTKARGKSKDKPYMTYISNLGNFDLNKDFLELSMQLFEYIENQLNIIKNEFEIRSK